MDVITFAGNREPTLHPEFPEIIDDTIERETPAKELEKAPLEVLSKIAAEVEQLGVKTNVAG